MTYCSEGTLLTCAHIIDLICVGGLEYIHCTFSLEWSGLEMQTQYSKYIYDSGTVQFCLHISLKAVSHFTSRWVDQW
jgi:hypothetical protein